MQIDIPLLDAQLDFVADCETQYLLFLGGYGSGKTYGFAVKSLVMALKNAGYVGTIMEPTGPLLEDILVPALDEVLALTQIPYEYEDNQKKPNYYIDCGGGKWFELRLRSAENWRRQIGSNQAFIGVDELDTLKKRDARKMIEKSDARIRKGNYLQFFAATTPEGFGFCHEFFEKEADESKRTIRARTSDNPFLPKTYIPRLKALYSHNLVEAYLEGRYVNLTSGSVYRSFDRVKNGTLTIDDGSSPLHIGMDFNVGKMAAVVHILNHRQTTCAILDQYGRHIPAIEAVDEIYKVADTPTMIRIIQNRYPGRYITVYPDSSGKNRRSTNATETDISLLRQAGFRLVYDDDNPAIKDRVNSLEALFENSNFFVNYKINPNKCPYTVESFEQQVWNEHGEPDKQKDTDHLPDAVGYFVYQVLPVTRSIIRQSRL